jgi:hypothetical protein
VAATPKPLLRQTASDASSNVAVLSRVPERHRHVRRRRRGRPADVAKAPSGEPFAPRIFAGIIGLLGGLGLQSVYSLARGFGRGKNSRAALIARAIRNTPPIAGEPLIATGVIRSDKPLVSPLGKVECVAYDYRMYTVRSQIGKGRPSQSRVLGLRRAAVRHRGAVDPLSCRDVPLPPGNDAARR